MLKNLVRLEKKRERGALLGAMAAFACIALAVVSLAPQGVQAFPGAAPVLRAWSLAISWIAPVLLLHGALVLIGSYTPWLRPPS